MKFKMRNFEKDREYFVEVEFGEKKRLNWGFLLDSFEKLKKKLLQKLKSFLWN